MKMELCIVAICLPDRHTSTSTTSTPSGLLHIKYSLPLFVCRDLVAEHRHPFLVAWRTPGQSLAP